MQMIPPHPIAELVPIASPEQSQRLHERIARLGRIRRPILLFEGMVLDGRHRQQACKELGIEPTYEEFRGTYGEAIDLVVDENLARRQISKEKVAETILKLNDALSKHAAERQRSGKKIDPNEAFAEAAEEAAPTLASNDAKVSGRTRDKVAKATGVSPKTVDRVVAVGKKGVDELKDALSKGEVKPGRAEQIAKLPPAEQKAAVAKIRGEEPPAPEPDAPIYPDDVREWFEPLRETMDRHQRNVGALRNWLRELGNLDEPRPGERLLHQDAKEIGRKIDSVYQFLSTLKPHAVCPECLGAGRAKNGDKCPACKGDRVVCEGQWQASSSENKSRVYVVR